MLPVVAIVGRPNVGKSTLFNCLTRSRRALVANEPGLTRDRQYGTAHLGDRHFIVVDTGGLSIGEEDDIAKLITGQAKQAIDEADVVLFMVDAREGLSASDEEIAGQLRRESKPVLLVANKTDGLDTSIAASDFYRLGLGEPLSISATHRRGTNALVDAAAEYFPHDDGDAEEAEHGIKVAVVGRPNVGKSTLVNRILGEDRVLAHDMPGTTRDSVYIPFNKRGRRYTLIDTAGIRRRARVVEKIERYSVIKSLQAIESANVIILLLDARAGVTDQDARLLGMVLDSGRALLLTVNKWDGLSTEERRQTRDGLSRKLAFVDFSKPQFISALHGSRVGDLVDSVDAAWAAASSDLDTSQLTRILENAVNEHPPPIVRGRRIKLRYAHQGGRNPPRIVIHGNQTAAVPDGYRRYLARRFRNALKLENTPVRIEFKTGENPYKGRRNVLTPRQQRKRQRLMRHTKR